MKENEKKKTLYLHIGTVKTGTSSIQDFCEYNRDALKKYNLFFPQGMHDGVNAVLLIDNFRANGDYMTHFNQMKSEIDNDDCSNILLSVEGMSMNEVEFPDRWPLEESSQMEIMRYKELFQEYDIKVIVYVRRSIDLKVSWWQERLKRRINNLLYPTLQEFIKLDDCYDKTINNFAKVFGKENVILKPFEQKQFKNGDLIDDFLSIFGIEDSSDFQRLPLLNLGINIPSCKLLQFLDKLNRCKTPFILSLREQLINISEIDKLKPIELLSNEEIIEVCDRNYPMECQLAKDFLGRDELFIDKYPSIVKDKNRKPKPFEAPLEYWKIIDMAIAESMQRQNDLILEELRELKTYVLQKNIMSDNVLNGVKVNAESYGILKAIRIRTRRNRYKIKRVIIRVFCGFIPSKKLRIAIRKRYL